MAKQKDVFWGAEWSSSGMNYNIVHRKLDGKCSNCREVTAFNSKQRIMDRIFSFSFSARKYKMCT